MSDSNNVIGWSFAEWGMKESEILDLFKNNIKKLYNVSYTNPKRVATLGISDIKIAGRSCYVHFIFDTEFGLNEIFIKPNEEYPVGYFESFYEYLTLNYGDEDKRIEEDGQTKLYWLFKSTSISLSYHDAWALDMLFVTIRYLANLPKKQKIKKLNKNNILSVNDLHGFISQAELRLSKILKNPAKHEIANERKEIITNLVDLIYRSAIRTFLTSIHNSYFKHMSLKMESYSTISPLLDKWQSILTNTDFVNKKIFSKFIDALNSFSAQNNDFTFKTPNNKETYTVQQFFEKHIWDVFFKEEEKRILSLNEKYCDSFNHKINRHVTDEYNVAVVGVSFYQDIIEEICNRRHEEGVPILVKAFVIPENNNPHDEYAVKIEINGKKIGFLSKNNARIFREIFSDGIESHAKIVWDRSYNLEGSYGVRLNLDLR